MLHPFTRAARQHARIDEVVAGREWAYVAVIGQRHNAALAIAFLGEPDYYRIPDDYVHGDSLREMQRHADELNHAEGVDRDAAARIVVSTAALPA